MFAFLAAVVMFATFLGWIGFRDGLEWWLILIALQFALAWPFPSLPALPWRRNAKAR